MADDVVGLAGMKSLSRGPAADLVRALARAFEAFASRDWGAAVDELAVVLPDHARLGGSRAQRDLVELTLAYAMSRVGESAAASEQLSKRRPAVMTPHCLDGFNSQRGSGPAVSAES